MAGQGEGPPKTPTEGEPRLGPSEAATGSLGLARPSPSSGGTGAAWTDKAPTLSPGAVLSGRYRILRFVAQGGMGEVYEAEDLELRERIAIKTVRAQIARDERVMERFRRESQFARRVTHPNVCRIFHIERHRTGSDEEGEEITFFTMEFLPGDTLSDRLRRGGRMTTAEAFPIVTQMAAGLAAAHKAGIVHRDFKSHNVILVPSPAEEGGVRAVVTDFGLARSGVEEDVPAASLTVTGVVLGTPAYMAPEQVEGGEVTAAADIYALGVVLFEMVTGTWPFQGETPLSIVVKRLNEPPPSPRILVPDLESPWERAILRCLERRPEDRFASAADVVRSLMGEAVAPSRRVLAARKRRMLRLAGLGLGIAAVAVAWRFWAERRPPPAPDSAPSVNLVQITTSAGLDIFPTFSPGGKAIAYSSDRTGSFEIYVRPLVPGEREAQVTSDGEQNVQPAWSPDGKWIAYHSKGRGGIWRIPATGGVPQRVRDFGSRPAWSPDSSLIAFQSDALVDLSANSFAEASIFVAPAVGGEAKRLTEAGRPPGGHGAPTWSPDGKRLVFVAAGLRASGVWSVSADGGSLFRVTEERFRTYDPAYSADGRAVYFSAVSETQSYGMWRAPVAPDTGRPAGEPVQVANLGLTTIRHLAISPDHMRIAYSAQSMRSNLWSLPLVPASPQAGGEPRALTAETTRNSYPVFSPDGSRIAFIKFSPGANSDIWVIDADGGNPLQLTTDPAIDYVPSWFPGGDRIAFQSNRRGGWGLWTARLDSGQETPLGDLGGGADVPRLSPDGRHFLFQKRDAGATNVWIVPVEGGAPRQITFDRELMGFACWSPDGKFVAAEAKRGEDHHVVVVPAAGGEPMQLTFGRGQHWLHSWSPDGDKIAFAGLREGSWNLYWVSLSTRKERRLTSYSKLNAYVRYPAWSPRGDRIVYEHAETTGNIWMIDGLK